MRYSERLDQKTKTLKISESSTKDFKYIGLNIGDESNKQYFRLYDDRELSFCGTLAEFVIEAV